MIFDCELQYQELLCTNVCILSQCSVSREGGLSVWENYSSSQSTLLFGNPDQAVQKFVIGRSWNNCCAFVERNSGDCGNKILLSFEEML